MKLEIEITEAEIKSAIERKIRVAIADKENEWSNERLIKDHIKKMWPEIVEKMVRAELENVPRMQEKIRNAIEAKLKGQLTAMMKGK